MKSKKVILVTGTNSGVGKCLVKYFSQNKNNIIIGCSRSHDKFKSKNFFHTQVNLQNENEIKQWIKNIITTYGKIDYLINNAAFAPAAFPALLNSYDLIKKTYELNVLGSFTLINEVAKHMIKKKFGRIISFSSMSVELNQEGTSLYSSSKSALIQYSKILAKEIGKVNVTSNIIGLSVYDSKSVEKLGNFIINKAREKLIFKKNLTKEEIIHAVNFFLHKDSKSITGQEIYLGLIKN
tara:strand:- start:376 stop:1089 length:714 start_codon:yes stop_codon:yes gene_type:complete